MAFPDITIPPETDHQSLCDKLQRFFQASRKYWRFILETEFTNLQDGDILTYDASKKKWINQAP